MLKWTLWTKSCSPHDSHNRQMEKCKRNEEAIAYVKELAIFLTMKVLENTPAGNYRLGKLLR